jgi:hypothetical protein
LKDAVTVLLESITATHSICPGPQPAPLQPEKLDPASEKAAKEIAVPGGTEAEQVVPQSMPKPLILEPATSPLPDPDFATLNMNMLEVAANVAVTEWSADMVTVHDPVPVQAPLQPWNALP